MANLQSKTILSSSVLTPSLSSGLMAVAAGLAVLFGTIVAAKFPNSDFQVLWRESQSHQAQRTLNDVYAEANQDLDENNWLSDAPLLVLWGGVGVVAYLFTMNLAKIYKEAEELKAELEYVRTDKNKLARELVIKTLFRSGMAIILFLFVQFSLRTVLPYAVAAASVASAPDIASLAYGALSFFVIVVSVHVAVILLRLIALRPRLFSAG